MDLDFKQLMRMNKKDLIGLITNLSEERDKEFHRAESALDELNDTETYEDDFHTLKECKDIMERIKNARWKLSLGVESEREDLEKLMEKLEGTILC